MYTIHKTRYPVGAKAAYTLANMFGKFFCHKLSANQGKMTNQLRWQLLENCWRDRKISPQIWKRTKIQMNTVPLSRKHRLCLSKKPTGDGSNKLFAKPRTNYTNIMFVNWFANKIFACVYLLVYI